MTASSIPPSKAQALTVATPAPGVQLTTDVFEAAVARLRASINEMFAEATRSFWVPPVIEMGVLSRTGYPKSFPHLLGEVANNAAGSKLGIPTGLALTSAACHHAYPLISDSIVDTPFCVAVEGTCFRNESSYEQGRLRSFRMREFVLVDHPDACLLWQEESLRRIRTWCEGLGLDVTVNIANDPFFGPGSRLMRESQRAQQLKWEVHAPVDEQQSQAIASCNYHKDHFSATFRFEGAGGKPVHSACTGFGLERIVMAMVNRHGDDVSAWPM
jgi:seryl-tRNA synthetase